MMLAHNHSSSGSNQYYPFHSMGSNPQFNNALRTPSAQGHISNSHSLSQVPDLMPSQTHTSWLGLNQPQQHQSQQHVPRAAHRLGHQRESSLSSLGSNGPASPFNPNTSNPQIAVSDSNHDSYQDYDSNYSYQLGKPLPDSLYTGTLANFNNSNGGSSGNTVDGLPNMSALNQRPRHDMGVAFPSDMSVGSSASRSHPVSRTSSTVGGDSPATPSMQEPEDDSRRRKNGEESPHDTDASILDELLIDSHNYQAGFHNGASNIPRLDRTMTDIYSDELYNPGLSFTSASPPHSQLAMSPPTNDLFAQRLQAANNQHMTNVQSSPASSMSRGKSPFQTQMARNNAQQQGTPNTISPKDAILEFNDADDGSNLPLFPQQESNAFSMDQLGNASGLDSSKAMTYQPAPSFQAMASMGSGFNFSMPSNISLPQQYPFVARPRQQQLTPAASTFSRMGSAETSNSELSTGPPRRPTRTAADGGTYTCTYHGCTLRFETPMELQKHKREGHRQANALNSMRPEPSPANGSPESLLNTQAGPHRCDRINPSTGKSCNTVFSRPYDLTRHEDTIHNARKRKVRCDLCTEEKTFSRADALTRHYRVCHPDVEFPGKQRRRLT